MNYKVLILLLVTSFTLITSCSSLRFPGVYRLTVQQGNLLEEAQISQLQKGMTRAQVRYILGSPLVEDSFHPDRWDYFYSQRKGDNELKRDHFAVFFKDDILMSWAGGYQAIDAEITEEQERALEETRKRNEAKLD